MASCSDRLMAALDSINGKWGRGTLRTGSVPVTPDWGMRRELMSQNYTTRLDQLWVVKASCTPKIPKFPACHFIVLSVPE